MSAYLSERRRLQSGGDTSSDLVERGRQAEARHQAREKEMWEAYQAKRRAS